MPNRFAAVVLVAFVGCLAGPAGLACHSEDHEPDFSGKKPPRVGSIKIWAMSDTVLAGSCSDSEFVVQANNNGNSATSDIATQTATIVVDVDGNDADMSIYISNGGYGKHVALEDVF